MSLLRKNHTGCSGLLPRVEIQRTRQSFSGCRGRLFSGGVAATTWTCGMTHKLPVDNQFAETSCSSKSLQR